MAVQTPRASGIDLMAILRQPDILLAVGIMVIVGMMIIPLPTPVVDLLLTINIAASVTILLVAIYTDEPRRDLFG